MQTVDYNWTPAGFEWWHHGELIAVSGRTNTGDLFLRFEQDVVDQLPWVTEVAKVPYKSQRAIEYVVLAVAEERILL